MGPKMQRLQKPKKNRPSKSTENLMSSQYVSTYNDFYPVEYKNKFYFSLVGLTLLGSGFLASAHAEVRKYDPASSSSQITLPRETNQTTQNQAQIQPQTTASPSLLPGVTSNTADPSAYVAQLQLLKPKEYKLGTARIFISADDLSPELIDHLKEVHALQDLHSEIYFQNTTPANLTTLFTEKIKDYPKGMEFNIDFNGLLANELHVKGQNVILYTDAQGHTAQYDIKSDYSFRAAMERIKQGVAQ
jgi:hypothetical protein